MMNVIWGIRKEYRLRSYQSRSPHEKSVMHEHPMSVGVNLTDLRGKFTFPDGTTEEISRKAGEVRLYPAGQHLPENLSDSALELILVELKAKSAS